MRARLIPAVSVLLFAAGFLGVLHGWTFQHDEALTVDIALERFELERDWSEVMTAEDAYALIDGESPLAPSAVIAYLRGDAGQPHPPAHHLLLNAWARIAGTGPLALRLPGLVLGLLAILGVRALGRRLAGSAACGDSAALILAVAPWFATIVVFLRPYALVLCASIWAAVALVEHGRSNRVRPWLAFVALSLIGLYSHYHYVFVLGWHLAAMAAIGWHRRNGVRGLAPALGAAAMVSLGYLPWLPSVLDVVGRGSAEFHYTTLDPSAARWLDSLEMMLRRLFLDRSNALREAWWGLVALTAAGAALVALGRKREEAAAGGGTLERAVARRVWLTAPLLPLGTIALDRWSGTNTFLFSKYSGTLLPLLVIGIAAIATGLPHRALRASLTAAWVALLAMASILGVRASEASPTPYRAFADMVAREDRPDHLIALPTPRRGEVVALLATLRDAGLDDVRFSFGDRERSRELLSVLGREGFERVTFVEYEIPFRPTWGTTPLAIADAARSRGWRVPYLVPERFAEAPVGDRILVVARQLRASYFGR